jgi:hypothetical protein
LVGELQKLVLGVRIIVGRQLLQIGKAGMAMAVEPLVGMLDDLVFVQLVVVCHKI